MPPFFIPILAFLVWTWLIFYHFPALKLGLNLTDALISPFFFISYLILIFAWAFSGPLVAALLSIASVFIVLYIAVAIKEPALFLQVFIYAVLFLSTVSFLQDMQKKLNDRRLAREKLMEDIHLIKEESLKKAVLEMALERKIGQFLNFHRFSETLKDIQDIGEAAQKVVGQVHQLLVKAEECALYLVNEAEQALSLAAAIRRDGEAVKEKQGNIFDQWVMKRGRSLLIEDAGNDFRFATERKEAVGSAASLCAVPLSTENKVLGVLRASASKREVFSADDLRLLDVIAGLGAVALRNRLLYSKMEELALRDSLTGLYLYRYFRERLDEEIARAHLNRSVFSVILLDVDFFKRYNDEYGHAAGDLVLKNVSAVISECLSRVDMAARYGGEEFVTLLPGREKKGALALAETMRHTIQKNKFVLRRVEGTVTASFGVATFPGDGPSSDALLRTADKYLYMAKNAGRNRVCGGT